MKQVRNLDDVREQVNHPYRIGEHFLLNTGEIFEVKEIDQEMQDWLDECYEEGFQVFYAVHWEGMPIWTEDGEEITAVHPQDEDEYDH